MTVFWRFTILVSIPILLKCFFRFLVGVPSTTITTGISSMFMFYSFFSSLAKSWYFSILSGFFWWGGGVYYCIIWNSKVNYYKNKLIIFLPLSLIFSFYLFMLVILSFFFLTNHFPIFSCSNYFTSILSLCLLFRLPLTPLSSIFFSFSVIAIKHVLHLFLFYVPQVILINVGEASRKEKKKPL